MGDSSTFAKQYPTIHALVKPAVMKWATREGENAANYWSTMVGEMKNTTGMPWIGLLMEYLRRPTIDLFDKLRTKESMIKQWIATHPTTAKMLFSDVQLFPLAVLVGYDRVDDLAVDQPVESLFSALEYAKTVEEANRLIRLIPRNKLDQLANELTPTNTHALIALFEQGLRSERLVCAILHADLFDLIDRLDDDERVIYLQNCKPTTKSETEKLFSVGIVNEDVLRAAIRCDLFSLFAELSEQDGDQYRYKLAEELAREYDKMEPEELINVFAVMSDLDHFLRLIDNPISDLDVLEVLADRGVELQLSSYRAERLIHLLVRSNDVDLVNSYERLGFHLAAEAERVKIDLSELILSNNSTDLLYLVDEDPVHLLTDALNEAISNDAYTDDIVETLLANHSYTAEEIRDVIRDALPYGGSALMSLIDRLVKLETAVSTQQ